MAASAQPDSESKTPDKDDIISLSSFEKHTFTAPTKRICRAPHIPIFITSPAYTKLLSFLNDLASSIQGQPISSISTISPSITKLLSLLSNLSAFADAIEPLPTPSRYGNKAFRIFLDKITSSAPALIKSLLPNAWIQSAQSANHQSLLDGIIAELQGYLLASFGDRTRIDYGTGHELTFICFLLILVELRIVKRADLPALVLRVFVSYIALMRKVQVRYGLEPAGTKGVWGLDDYQFLVFFFGAAQLEGHQSIAPGDILDKKVLEEGKREYMYLGSIDFILRMKRGPFAEHSPLLNDISGVALWSKVRKGLLKMYCDDVLKKLPVVQHFLFGSVLSVDLPEVKGGGDEEKEAMMRRKQALIDKLNAKNPKFQKEQGGSKQAAPMVVTAAPWAKKSGDGDQEMVGTKAPWAK